MRLKKDTDEMDKNKLRLLEDNSYRIGECCALCVYRNFPNKNSAFGTCKRLKYNHLKHNYSEREMSVNRYGRCVHFFEIDEVEALVLLNDFMRFFEK